MTSTLALIDRLCTCLIQSSFVEDHPSARYGYQLQRLRRTLSDLADGVRHHIVLMKANIQSDRYAAERS